MLRSLQRFLQSRFLAKASVIIVMLLFTASVNAADSPLPEGTRGWWYYIDIYHSSYAGSAEQACQLNAQNHMGTALVDMGDPVGEELHISCWYPHFLYPSWISDFASTHLVCEYGYRPTSEGICSKMTAPEPAPPLNCTPGKAGYGVGNPVLVASGAKVQNEVDLVGTASDFLKVERTYRAFRSVLKSTSGGKGWSFWFDRAFVTTGQGDDGRPRVIEATSSDGTYFKFEWNSTDQKYQSSYDKSATLEALTPTFDDWLLTYRGQADRYQKIAVGGNTGFVLVKSQRLDGSIQNYSYKPDTFLVQEIADERGRRLVLTWGANKQVASISGPDGSIKYEYDFPWGNYPSSGQISRLVSVHYFDALGVPLGTKLYHHEDTYSPFLLTGITDENGDRFASYAYDSSGRTILSEHAGGAYRYSFAYPDKNSRIITDPLGAQRTSSLRYIDDVGLVTGESQPGGSGCAPGSSVNRPGFCRGSIV